MKGFSVNYDGSVNGVEYNDLYLDSSGILAINSGNDNVIENCYHAIQLMLGEYDYNVLLGIPWNDYISSAQPIGRALQASLTSAIQNIDGVSRVRSITFNPNRITRQLTIIMQIVLVGGEESEIIYNQG